MIKFLILSPPRVGSQLLIHSLECEDNTIVNEIFTHLRYTKGFTGNVSKRFEHPIEYINFFLNKSTTKTCGAKILINSFPDYSLDNLLENGDFHYIYIYRKNLLESAVSISFARHIKRWMLSKGDKLPPIDNYKVDINGAKNIMQKSYDRTKYCLESLNKNKRKHIIVTYEEIYENNLINMGVLNKVRKFVELSPHKIFEPVLQKQCGKEQYSKIINRKELEEEFGEMYGYLGSRVEPKIWLE
jgi:LPS sulfotransferase NodH